MTMTTAKEGEVIIWLDGTVTADIDWGDGTPIETVTLPYHSAIYHTYFIDTPRTITIIGDNVTKLICGQYRVYNQFTALDVSKNTTLRTLDCQGNQLTVLDVNKNTALDTLICDFNQLTALDVSKIKTLKTLSCQGNQLTTLDVSKNTALTYLNCGDNQLY